jgi:hypothetical protein
MSVVIDGTTGISGNDGSAATPALRVAGWQTKVAEIEARYPYVGVY